MHRDGRFEPLLVIAEGLGLVTAAVAAAIYRHRCRVLATRPDRAALRAEWQAYIAGRGITIETPRSTE